MLNILNGVNQGAAYALREKEKKKKDS